MGDPSGLMFGHLRSILPQLEKLFDRVLVSVDPDTAAVQPAHVSWLEKQPLFSVVLVPGNLEIGEHFLALYQAAATQSPPDQVLHLCFIDRLAFALQTGHQERFIADIQGLAPGMTPMLYQRSETAWESHPENYREIESMLTRAGELLLGRPLDYAWCHIALQAETLKAALQKIKSPDLSMVAEMVILLVDDWHTQEVDWLAWEDPFIFGQNPDGLRARRESSRLELHKRFSYVIPMMGHLLTASQLNEYE